MKACSIHGCGNPAKKRTWCIAHYRRWQRHGDPQGGTTRNGAPAAWLRDVAFAYEGDECLPFPFSLTASGYGQFKPAQGAHRAVCVEAHGPPPTPQHEAAHSCDNKPCCNKRHLRWATRTDNIADRYEHAGRTLRDEAVRKKRREYMRHWRSTIR